MARLDISRELLPRGGVGLDPQPRRAGLEAHAGGDGGPAACAEEAVERASTAFQIPMAMAAVADHARHQ